MGGKEKTVSIKRSEEDGGREDNEERGGEGMSVKDGK